MITFEQGHYPVLHLTGVQLPFSDHDQGTTFDMIAKVRLLGNIKDQGHNYNFEVLAAEFPGRGGAKDSLANRKNRKLKQTGQSRLVRVEVEV